MEVSLSILTADFNKMDEVLFPFTKHLKYLHLDVMDGKFVPNQSFDEKLIAKIRHFDFIFDTHLMIINPKESIEKYVKAGSDMITFHLEATNNPKDIIDYIHSFGIKAGISIKPKTEVKEIEALLPFLDLVLVMSVEPGFGGQKFMPSAVDKLKRLVELKKANNYNYLLSVDGGINADTIDYVKDYVDLAVSGSYIINASDPLTNLAKLTHN